MHSMDRIPILRPEFLRRVGAILIAIFFLIGFVPLAFRPRFDLQLLLTLLLVGILLAAILYQVWCGKRWAVILAVVICVPNASIVLSAMQFANRIGPLPYVLAALIIPAGIALSSSLFGEKRAP